MTPKTVAIGVALVLVSAVASAKTGSSFMNGNELKKYCHGERAYDGGVCLGFTSAVAGIVANEPVAGWRACIPDGVTRGQVNDVVMKFLDDHPEKLHIAAADLAAHAFAEAFPCPK